MIDFHSHLDLYQDALKLLPLVSVRNAFTLVVTTSPRAWQATSRVFSDYGNIKIAVGLHPEIAQEKVGERALFLSSISKAKFVGEVGLDGSLRFKESLLLQESIFTEILKECEQLGGRILSIHSRNAATRVLDIIERNSRISTPVLHWFSGTIQETCRAVALGCWFSVGPAMLAAAKGRAILAKIPMGRVLPETDGPFATRRSVPLMPWEAIDIVDDLAPLWGTSKRGACRQIKQNLAALLGRCND